MLDKEIEALGLLAYKRGLFYESKKDSLREDIERLRKFLEAMAKDRESLQKQTKAEHLSCKKMLVKTEAELHDTQIRLREVETEAACLLESKHMEMERLQTERDDAWANVDTLCAESCFLRSYGNHLEGKVRELIIKLNECHQQLQRKAEEVVQTRGRTVNEWEWIQHSMAKFEKSLLEFKNANAQLSLEKENYVKELEGVKQLERIKSEKSKNALTQAEENLHFTTQTIGELQGKLQKMEHNFAMATQGAESLSSQLNEANAAICALQDQVDKLHGQLEAMQEKILDFIKDKLEADAATQLREAAISVLKLRIYALEGDLQKEEFLRTNHLPDSGLKYLTQFSPAIDVEVWANRSVSHNNLVQMDQREGCPSTDVHLETSKRQLDELFKPSTMLIRTHPELEISKGVNGWSMERIRKLEQTLAKAHQRYICLRQDPKILEPRVKSAYACRGNSSGGYGIQAALCFSDEFF